MQLIVHNFIILEPDCSCYPDCTSIEITPAKENPDEKVSFRIKIFIVEITFK